MRRKIFGMVLAAMFALGFYGCASYTATAPANTSSAQNAISSEKDGVKAIKGENTH